MHLLLLLLLLPYSSCQFTVRVGLVGQEGEGRMNGSSVQLSPSSPSLGLWCSSSSPWDVCKWYRPGFSPSPQSPDACSCYPSPSPCSCPDLPPAFSPWSIARQGELCILALGPLRDTAPSDSGWWRCLLSPLNSNSSSTFGEAMLMRESMEEPSIDFSPGGELQLQEGESHRFNCSVARLVSGGLPRIGWVVGGGGEEEGEEQRVDGEVGEGGEVAGWSLHSSLDYRGRLGDTTIHCEVTAVDHIGVQVSWRRSWSGLTVLQPGFLRAGFQTWQLLLLILLPLLLLLLLLLLLCCCRGWCCFSPAPKMAPSPPPSSPLPITMLSPLPRSSKAPRPSPYMDPALPVPAPAPLKLVLPWDPYRDLRDCPKVYREEGRGSTAPSLSSLASSGGEEELELGHQLEAMGHKFATLATLYREEEEEETEEEEVEEESKEEQRMAKQRVDLSLKEELHGELIGALGRRSLAEPQEGWRAGRPNPSPTYSPSSFPSTHKLPSLPSLSRKPPLPTPSSKPPSLQPPSHPPPSLPCPFILPDYETVGDIPILPDESWV